MIEYCRNEKEGCVMKTKTKFVIVITTIVVLSLLLLTNNSQALTDFKIEKVDVTLTGTKAEISWNEVTDADGYDIYVELPIVGYQYAGSVLQNKVSIVGLQEAENYKVKVQAYKVENNTRSFSDFSPEIEFKAGENTTLSSEIGTVDNITGVSYGTTGLVQWNKVENADGYEVYANVGNSEFQNFGTVKSNKVEIKGMHENAVYSVKVQPFSQAENGEKTYGTFSAAAVLKYDIGDTETKPDKVRNVKVSMNGNDATLTWNEVTDADGYEVVVKVPSKGEYTYDAYDNQKVLTDFTPNSTYTAKVRAYKYVDGDRFYGDFSSTVSIRYEREIGTVQNLKVEVVDKDAFISWDSVNNADGYEMELTIPGSGSEYIYTTKTNAEINNIDLKEGQYSVRVRACIENNGEREYGDYSSRQYFQYEEKIEAPAKVTGLNAEVNGTRVELDWNKVSGADGYEVELYIPGEGTETFNATTNKKTIYNIDYTTREYWVRVRAYVKDGNDKIYGDYSSKEYFQYEEEIEKPSKVTGLDVEIKGTRAELDWNKVSGADGYEVELYIPGEGTETFNTTTNKKTIYNIDSTTREYWARVRAYVKDGNDKIYGDYSSKEYFQYEEEDLAKVTGLKVTMNGTDAKISWNSVKNADGYEVEIYLPGEGSGIVETLTNSKKLYNLDSFNGEYWVRVRAYKEVGNRRIYGDFSSKKYFECEEENTSLGKVTGLNVVRNGTRADFSWNKVSGADGYELVVYIPGIGDCTYGSTKTSTYLTDFTEAKNAYSIKVRAYQYENGRKVYGAYSSTKSF